MIVATLIVWLGDSWCDVLLCLVYRLEREKVKIEEMKLETLERERARLEGQLIDLRQRVDREREELKRVETMRLEEMRRAAAMPVKRPYEQPSRSNSGRYDDSWENKRPATNDR